MIGTCTYCGRRGIEVHRDHIIPASRGGGDEAHNCLVACVACNLEKSDRTPSEWQPEGLPWWIYELEGRLAVRYRMPARGRRHEAGRQRLLVCDICGGGIPGMRGVVHVCDQEVGPAFRAQTTVAFNEHGGRRLFGATDRPSFGPDRVDSGDWSGWARVTLFTHFECGGEDLSSYSFVLARLGWDWESHLRAKVWWVEEIAISLQRAREIVGIQNGGWT